MPRVLFTKKISEASFQSLYSAGITVDHYDAIKIKFLEVPPVPTGIDHAIFTSQNAVHAFFQNHHRLPSRVSCVGSKTEALLRENGTDILFQAENAAQLCKQLISRRADQYLYFCGNRRMDTLPAFFSREGIAWTEQVVYETLLNPESHPGTYDAIVFMSPSAIESYLQRNQAGDALAICIGSTTANAAKTNFENVKIADTPTIESLVTLTKYIVRP